MHQLFHQMKSWPPVARLDDNLADGMDREEVCGSPLWLQAMWFFSLYLMIQLQSLDRGSKGVTSLPGASSGTVHRQGNSDWGNDWVSWRSKTSTPILPTHVTHSNFSYLGRFCTSRRLPGLHDKLIIARRAFRNPLSPVLGQARAQFTQTSSPCGFTTHLEIETKITSSKDCGLYTHMRTHAHTHCYYGWYTVPFL